MYDFGYIMKMVFDLPTYIQLVISSIVMIFNAHVLN